MPPVVLLLALPAAGQENLARYAQPTLQDVTATVKVVGKTDRELAKIGKGYVDAYKLESQELTAKEPDRVRFEGKRGLLTIRYITNGTRKLTQVSTPRINKVDDISKEPAKGDSISDAGLITPAWVARVEDRWLRSETRDGKTLHVFEYFYKEDPKYIHTLWVDPETKTIVERIDHHRSKIKPGFKKRFLYSEVQTVNGVNMPSKVVLLNGENKVAAIMRYDRIKVNTGLPDKLFSF